MHEEIDRQPRGDSEGKHKGERAGDVDEVELWDLLVSVPHFAIVRLGIWGRTIRKLVYYKEGWNLFLCLRCSHEAACNAFLPSKPLCSLSC